MNEMRLFVAVTLSAEVKRELGLVSEVMAGRLPERSVRWVKPELMHITLCFLGETAVSKLEAITQTMDKVAQNKAPISLRLNGTGCFPNAKRPRVVWVGLTGQVAELATIKQELDTGLAVLGWKMEKRRFKPHLTLGRVKDVQKLREVSWEVDVQEVVVGITAVHLIESQLTREGPIYTTRHISQFT